MLVSGLRTLLVAALVATAACSAPPPGERRERPGPAPATAPEPCRCGTLDGCDCPHCASMGDRFQPGACPCGGRGERER